MADDSQVYDDLARQLGAPKGAPAPGPSDDDKIYQDVEQRLNVDSMLRQNPTLTDDLRSMARFSGHGVLVGLADDLGMPVDSLNSAIEFAQAHPVMSGLLQAAPGVGALQGVGNLANAAGVKPMQTGGAEFFRKKLGSYGTTPKEEGDESYLGQKGYDISEFIGSALPFGIGGAARKLAGGTAKAALSAANTLLLQPGLVGFTASTGKDIGEAAGYPRVGEDVGFAVGAFRSKGIMSLLSSAKRGASWVHSALGLGTGAEGKVRQEFSRALAGSDPLARASEAPAGVDLPTDIKFRNNGLIALSREIRKTDAEMAGEYDKAELALSHDIESTLDRINPKGADTPEKVEEHLNDVQHEREVLTNLRMLQAVDQASRTVDEFLPDAIPRSPDSEAYQSARVAALRFELGRARDDSAAVTRSEWQPVDLPKRVEAHGLYDAISVLEDENNARPRPDQSRFPSEVIDKFFKTDEQGNRVPLYGAGTTLQNMVDASSDIEHAIRVESDTTKGVPDPVRLSYLRRLAEAVNHVKYGVEGAETDPNLKRAIAATKFHHETFTNGPVGKVLGHTEGGEPIVSISNTLRPFLAKGKAGIDAYNKLLKALAQRTGKSGKTVMIGGQSVQMGDNKPTMSPRQLLEQYLKQDFHEHAFPNGNYNPAQARQWLANHAGPMLAHPEIRKDMEAVIESYGKKKIGKDVYNKAEDASEKSAARLFLQGEPGKRFNAVMQAPNQYEMMTQLLADTARDTTGRATRGLARMAMERMFMDATVYDGSTETLSRLDGRKLYEWIKENRGLIRALEEARRPLTPKEIERGTKLGRKMFKNIGEWFDEIAKKAEYLQLFRVNPDIPQPKDSKMLLMPMTHLLAALSGANLGAKLGKHMASLQTASIGSSFLRRLAEKLTPDQARVILRKAFLDPAFFETLNTPITPANEAKQVKATQNYLLGMVSPLIAHDQSDQDMPEGARQAPDGHYYVPDPDRPGKYLRVDQQ